MKRIKSIVKSILKSTIKRNKFLYKGFDKYLYIRQLILYSISININKRYIQKNPKQFIEFLYKKNTGKKLNLENPLSFNEKLQWLKLYWYDKRATVCADKYRVREYIKEKGFSHLLNDLIGVYDNSSQIDIKMLPNKFVLKPNHDSGHSLICTDKKAVNWRRELKRLDFYLQFNFSYVTGEWPYRDIKPRIICEKYLEDSENNELKDFKVLCFNGYPKLIEVHNNRLTKHTQDYYDIEWKKTEIFGATPKSDFEIKKPVLLEKMLEYSSKLAQNMPFLRVDWYIVDNKLIFGELTFFPAGGCNGYSVEIDKLLGSWLSLKFDSPSPNYITSFI